MPLDLAQHMRGIEDRKEGFLAHEEIRPVHPKGNQSWMFIGRTDVEVKLQYFGHLMQRTDSFEQDLDAGKDWRWEEKGTTEDEMVGWHHRLSGHEFVSTLGVGDGQGGLACCSPWGCEESDTTERLNWTSTWGAQPRSGRSSYLGPTVFLSSAVCHSSCASCSGPRASHCTTCAHPQALRQGHCLPSCGEGFYPDHGVCKGIVGIIVTIYLFICCAGTWCGVQAPYLWRLHVAAPGRMES